MFNMDAKLPEDARQKRQERCAMQGKTGAAGRVLFAKNKQEGIECDDSAQLFR